MAQRKPSKKKLKLMRCLVGEDPSLASGAGMLLYPGDRLESLAANLNNVEPDSPYLADLVERLLARPPAKQDWVEQKELAFFIGPTPCTPAPGSPLYDLNMFLASNPCFLRIEGLKRADGSIGANATHIPIPPFRLSGTHGLALDPAVEERLLKLTADLTTQRILWLLWEVFDRNIDLTRLKRCPVCKRWFVDHTKRGNKARCTTRCTSRQWTWEERKKAGHKLRGVKSDISRTQGRPLSHVGHGSDMSDLQGMRQESSIRF